MRRRNSRCAGWGLALAMMLSWAPVVAPAGMRVLASTFPVYQLARQVVSGREGATLELLLPAALGCPHHYALTPRDLRLLADADVLVVNGLGLEEFLGAPVKKANPDLMIVEASAGIDSLLAVEGACDHDGAHTPDHGSEDCHAAVNPHLFASPRMAARMVMTLADGLSRADPGGAAVYAANARAFAARLNALADAMAARAQRLKNRRIVQPHGVFDYLARDLGLEIVAILQPHGREPSAAEMLALVARARERKAGAVFVEPQYADKVGRTLAREIGIPCAALDPVASGPADVPADHYETVMRRNLEILCDTLGVHP